ncbi:MAG: hypothetical protein IH586_05470 [Anaerolineaceae bacterium]|nr:hypothetical protein [Anaerolineaceae bacterium]
MLEQKNLDQGFSPLDTLNQALRFWWFLFVLIFLGGMVGVFIHQLRPPVYEAIGHFTATIDYVATGPLTQYDEDVALNAVGNVILSRLVLDRLVIKAKAEGIIIDRPGLIKMAVLERRFTTWDLRVRSTDLQTAEQITNLWVEEGQAQLLESYQHTIQAEQISTYIQSMESCLGKSVTGEPSTALCTRYRFADIQDDLQKAGKALAQERKAALGLFSGLRIGPAGSVSISKSPVAYGRNQLVLAGGLIGLLVGFWLLNLGVPARWLKRS